MFRGASVVVAALLVCSLASGPAVGDAATGSLQTPDRFDSTTFQVTVYENGSARWAIVHETPLTNESQRENFEAYASEFERNRTDLYASFVRNAGALTRFGTNATDREMNATDFRRSASVRARPGGSIGQVRMSFRWTNFARVDGDRVVVADVFEGGFYVGPDQALVVERGPGLAFAQVLPQPDSQSNPDALAGSESVTWNGERSFVDQRPYVELRPRSAVETQSGGDGEAGQQSDGTSAEPTPGESGDGSAWPLMAAALLIALGVVAAAAWRSSGAPSLSGLLGSDDGATAATDGTAEPASEAGAEQATDEPAVPDEELLSDSDRVLSLLEENGGRMKQVDIVERTDWSKSKVSMLLSDMEDDGEISKLRVGRENIISIAGEEPDAAGSPFDEE
ncbi:helix-turn-helix transcriptional regulator [Haloarcula litorea]|uniref:helix-turn-helix transcriptional regulator n=1 Tax=Haloarcula litorea TaxID=3032579 RepID=UPI0023E7F372|nr:helix-turn-helix domain-containing protein [Halomicroarcula sp. GDY20]